MRTTLKRDRSTPRLFREVALGPGKRSRSSGSAGFQKIVYWGSSGDGAGVRVRVVVRGVAAGNGGGRVGSERMLSSGGFTPGGPRCSSFGEEDLFFPGCACSTGTSAPVLAGGRRTAAPAVVFWLLISAFPRSSAESAPTEELACFPPSPVPAASPKKSSGSHRSPNTSPVSSSKMHIQQKLGIVFSIQFTGLPVFKTWNQRARFQ